MTLDKEALINTLLEKNNLGDSRLNMIIIQLIIHRLPLILTEISAEG